MTNIFQYMIERKAGDTMEGFPNIASLSLSPASGRGDFEAKFGIPEWQDQSIIF